MFDIETLTKLDDLQLGEEHVKPHGLQFISDDLLLVTTEATHNVAIVNITARAVAHSIDTAPHGCHMIDYIGNHAFCTDKVEGVVSVLDLIALEVVNTIFTGRGAQGIATGSTATRSG